MGILHDGQQYLIEQYAIAVAPGLQLVDPKPLTEQQLAAIAAGLSKARHGFSPLRYVEQEVNQVQASLSSQVLLNENFTQPNLATALSNTPYPVVHLATHGQFSSDPEQTFILAWDRRIPLADLNQLLRSSDQSRSTAIELLVLSACQTASGDDRATLGLAGVAIRAGARSTLASLWNLDDETSALLVSQFYQALQEPGMTKAKALQKAQIALLHTSNYDHPMFWAPFILVGNWL
jgi:CHAT domain-containing protein